MGEVRVARETHSYGGRLAQCLHARFEYFKQVAKVESIEMTAGQMDFNWNQVDTCGHLCS